MTQEELHEIYEERAAIMHFDGGLPIEKAEALARAERETWCKANGMIFDEVEAKRGAAFECIYCYPRLCRCKEAA